MKRPRILLTRRWPASVEQHLQERYETMLNAGDVALGRSELQQAMRSCDALCVTVSDAISADIIDTPARTVRLLANFGVGTDHIDLAAARNAGITVTNTPDVLTDATADLAILLMLMATRRAGEGERTVRSHRWNGWCPTQLLGQSVRDKTLGLVGLGRIAQATARRARTAFGMKIIYHSRTRAAAAVESELSARYVESMDALAGQCDVLSLHCPGGVATRHLIDARRLALMKPSAVLVNTARGSVVDEDALAQALGNRRIAAAGLDVYEREPVVHPRLMTLENVVLLPHLGSATMETRVAMGMRVANNVERFFSGQAVLDPV